MWQLHVNPFSHTEKKITHMRLRNALNLTLMNEKSETTSSDNQSKLSPWVVFSLAFSVKLAVQSHHTYSMSIGNFQCYKILTRYTWKVWVDSVYNQSEIRAEPLELFFEDQWWVHLCFDSHKLSCNCFADYLFSFSCHQQANSQIKK